MRTIVAFILTLAVSPLLSAGTATATVRLVLDEATVLPGTRTGLTVTITNRGKKELRLPVFLWITARDDVRASAKDLIDHIPTREQLLKKPEAR